LKFLRFNTVKAFLRLRNAFFHIVDTIEIMKTQRIIIVLITLVLITACGSQPVPVPEQDSVAVPEETAQEILPPVETAPSNCLGDEVSPIGQSIADDFDTASYEQVMIWFCNGAEFEDILVALETEAVTDSSADEILQMLADGFTWEEIWLLIGFVE